MLSQPLLDAIRSGRRRGRRQLPIVCPQSDRVDAARIRRRAPVRAALSDLRAEGIDAHGQIAHPDPYIAAMETKHDERVDEVIVSTFPGERSGWLRRDLVGRLRAGPGFPSSTSSSSEPLEATRDGAR